MAATEQVAIAATIAPLGDPADACAWLSSLGIRGVQLSATHPSTRPRDMGSSARRDLRGMIARLGLRVSGIDLWIPSAHYADAATTERAIDAVRDACDLAGALDRAVVCIALPAPAADAGAGAAPTAAFGTDHGAASGADLVRNALRQEAVDAIAEATDRHGVRIADASGAVEGLRSPPFGALIDPAAILASGGDPARAVAAAGARIAAARVVDQLRSGLRGPVGLRGESRLDLMAYRVALEIAGFRGLPVIDARQWADARGGIEQSLEAWRTAIPAMPQG